MEKSKIEFRGWVIRKRDHGKIIFIDLRSIQKPYYPLQVVVKKEKVDEKTWKLASSLTQESSIIVRGELVENPRAPGGRELLADEVEITHIALQPYPLGKKDHSPEVLMFLRHLTIRSPRYTKIWKIRESIINFSREYFQKNKWYEVYPPILVSGSVEGGATLFEVKYFEENVKVYLSQSAQLYLEAMIFSLGKVWSLTPSFRAEKSRTRRHLAEYWHLEAEAAWLTFEGNLKVQEELISYIVKKALEDENLLDLIREFRKDDLDTLENVKPPFKRIKYDEAIDLLQSKGLSIKWGDDIGADEERVLSNEIGEFFFLTHFPKHLKAFYVKIDEKNEELSLSADLLAPEGYGEIIGGSEREDKIDILEERIKNEGLNIESYQWYLDLRRYGSVPHSGFGLGIERFLQWFLKLDHIRETLPFPRLARFKKII